MTPNQMKTPNSIFCQYRKNGISFCGLVAVYQERCKKHLGMVSSEKKIASGRFRGASKFQKEVLGFKGVKES